MPLSNVINKSISQGIVPTCMKKAKIIPIYKAKDEQQFTNYRPISLLPTISKVLEKVMHKRLYNFLNSENILFKSQYGFRKKHSTNHAISELVMKILDAFDNKEYTVGIFLDLSKAFDTIDHSLLINKLKFYGIRGIALEWFKGYLSDRKQFVDYNGIPSGERELCCGVPQGSVLGPLLFILYTNDLPACLQHASGILFADDTTIYYSHKDLKLIHKAITMDMACLEDWFKANKLSLNISKTNYVIFHPANRVLPPIDWELKMGTEIIERKATVKFLGMFIDEHLKWASQLSHVTSKMAKSLYVINSLKTILPIKDLKTLYYTMIYPYLTYGIESWGSAQKGLLHKANILQRKVVRSIGIVKYNDPVSPVFKSLHLLQCSDIYDLQVLKLMYAYMQNDLPLPLIEQFTRNTEIHGHNTRQNRNPHVQMRQTSLAAKSIVHYGPLIWSKLPNEIKNVTLKSTFVRKCKKYMLELY